MVDVLTHNQTFSSPQEALAHYGVKGMKWGVTKDRPSSAASSASGDDAILGVYAVLIGGFLIARARMNYNDSGKKEAKVLLKEEKKTGIKHEWKKNDKLTGDKTHEELMRDVVPQINQGFPTERGTSMNCRRCTFAYEMRRRGHDVKATRSVMAAGQDQAGLINAVSPKTATSPFMSTKTMANGWGQNAINTTTPDGRMYLSPEKKAESIFSALGKEPNGSRGELAFSWAFGGGHSIAYEIVNNRPIIIDNQSGKSWPDTKSFSRDMTPIMGTAAFTRLDNVELNNDFMKRWVADA